MKKNKVDSAKIRNNPGEHAYLPNERDDYHLPDEDLISTAPNGDITMIPNPVTDDIVVNNIAWQEFNYTDSMADRLSEIESVKKIQNQPKSHTKNNKK